MTNLDPLESVNVAKRDSVQTAEQATVVELGCPGHFIAARSCYWRRHTQVGNYRVSSVGDYRPDHRTGIRETIGAGPNAYFETMVFRTQGVQEPGNEGCGCRFVDDYSALDCERYATAGEAQAGHERYIAKYRVLGGNDE